MLIYKVLKNMAAISVFLCFITCAYYIWYAIKNLFKRDRLSFANWICMIKTAAEGFTGKHTKLLLIISLFAALITNTAIHQLVGVHNLELKPEGVYCFYVEADLYGGGTYTLPAQVRVELETEEISDDKTKTYRLYYIEKVVFSDGDWLDTEDCEPDTINEPSYFYDPYDNEWGLVLLNEHAYSPFISETNNAEWLDILLIFIDCLPILLILYALCYKEDREKS